MSETIEIACPVCEKHSRVPVSYAGKLGKCPGCLSTIRVPGVDEMTSVDDGGKLETVVAAPVKPVAPQKVVDEEGEEDDGAEPEGEAVERKPCPFCGEKIRVRAKKCRYCGEFLDTSLKKERRQRIAGPRLKWAFPMAVMILLPVQVMIALICAAVCAFEGAEEPSGVVWGFSAFFSFVWLVTIATPPAAGNRLRLLALMIANGVHFGACGLVITTLNIRPNPPSPLLGSLHLALALFVGWIFWLAYKAHQEQRERR